MSSPDKRVRSECIEGLSVRATDGGKVIDLPPAYSRHIMPANRRYIPTRKTAESIPHLQKISCYLSDLQNCDIVLLIGYNCATALLPRDVIPAPYDDGPFGVKTDLGWSILVVRMAQEDYDGRGEDPIGISHRLMTCEFPVSLRTERKGVVFSQRVTMKEEIAPSDVVKVLEADFLPDRPEKPYSQNDKKCLKVMEDGIHINETGQYEMPLPFKKDEPNMPNNQFQAERRLESLRRKFSGDVVYHAEYTKVIDSLIANDYAEFIPDPARFEKSRWYIPHHGVQQSNKLRVVFDFSTEFKDVSLNKHLTTGPDMTNSLSGVLSRFRLESVALMCDVKEMFRQFRVNKEHRDYLRFLWWAKGDYHQPFQHCRMKVHLFGASSSPGCANYGLKRIASDNAERYGQDVVNFIHNNFYEDDGLLSVPTSTDAINMIAKTKMICVEGKLHLHKFEVELERSE